MQSWLRYFLPFGLVRASQLASELATLGVPRARALRLATKRSTATRLRQHNLDLLPPNALAGSGCVVDVGANVGEWTATVLDLTSPARVLCVEPDPKLVPILRRRFVQFPMVEVCETALGSSIGLAEFNLMANPVLNSLRQPAASMSNLFPESFQIKERIQVKLCTLDTLTLTLPQISILKIDAQGFEREILLGGAETLRKTEYVLLEVNFRPHYEKEASFTELNACMQKNGFCISNYSEPKGGRRQAMYADVLYVRKDS